MQSASTCDSPSTCCSLGPSRPTIQEQVMTLASRSRALRALAPAVAIGFAAACAPPATTVSPGPEPASAAASTTGFTVPVEYHTLENGLKVVLSKDTTAPTATVAVYYNIG